MRTKEELENAIKVITHYRETLPQYDVFGHNNWEEVDSQLYYLKHALELGYVPLLADDDTEYASEAHVWLSGDDGFDFYDSILEELVDIK